MLEYVPTGDVWPECTLSQPTSVFMPSWPAPLQPQGPSGVPQQKQPGVVAILGTEDPNLPASRIYFSSHFETHQSPPSSGLHFALIAVASLEVCSHHGDILQSRREATKPQFTQGEVSSSCSNKNSEELNSSGLCPPADSLGHSQTSSAGTGREVPETGEQMSSPTSSHIPAPNS